MKKKHILLALAMVASMSLVSCGEEKNPVDNPVEVKAHDRGTKDDSESNIVLPDVIIPKKEEENVEPEPEPVVTPEPEPEPEEVNADETISFDEGNEIVTDAGTGRFEELEDGGELLYATTNIGYEFLGWYSGNKLLSTNTIYKNNDDINVTAKYKLKDEFKYFEFTSTETECVITGIKDENPLDLVIPEGVTRIDDYAFKYLKAYFVTLPQSLNSIGYNAFTDSLVYKLTLNGIPALVDYDAFYNSYINEIYLPEDILESEEINEKFAHDNYTILYKHSNDESIFAIKDDFLFSYWEGEWSVIRYAGDSKDIVFPDGDDVITEYGVYVSFYDSDIESVTFSSAVVSIGSEAFEYCNQLKEVIIPDSVTYIGSNAFFECMGLEKVVIGNGLTTIESSAFKYCSNLNSLTLGENIETISNDAFAYCNKLSEIIIPKNVDYIGSNAFYDCTSLFTVYNLSELELEAGSYDNGRVAYYAISILNSLEQKSNVLRIDDFLYEIDEDEKVITLLSYVGSDNKVAVPSFEGYEVVLASYLFSQNYVLEEIDLGKSVKTISNNAFSNCTNLKKVSGENVEYINDYAFYSCRDLEEIEISKCKGIGGYAFNNCLKLTNIDLSECEYINDYAFYSCSSLQEVDAPKCENLGSESFSYCRSLKRVNLPKVPYIPSYCFQECRSLMSVNATSIESIGSYAFYYCYNLSDITLPEGLTSIGYNAFYSCYSLYQLTIPSTLSSIGSNAFYNTINMTEIINKSSLDIKAKTGGYGYISYYVDNVINISSTDDLDVVVKNNTILNNENGLITYVDNNNRNVLIHVMDKTVKKLVIPSDVDYINKFVLYNIESEELEINTPFSTAYNANFFGYYFGADGNYYNRSYVPSTLKKVVLGNKVDYIPSSSFYGIELESLTFGSSVTEIGASAFQYAKIDNIYYDGNESDWCKIYFSNSNSNPLSEGSKIYFKENDEYIEKKNLVISNDLGVIGNYQFIGFNIESISLPDTITSIGEYAFEDCVNLTTINFPNGITSIGDYAFRNCKLKEAKLPTSLSYLGNYSFYGNSFIKNIEIAGTVLNVGDSAFENCIGLQSVKINEGTNTIGNSAFEKCRSLYTLILPNTLEEINESAFEYCENLENVNLSNTNVGVITEAAFKNCKNLANIEFSAVLYSIGSTSFDGCDKLKFRTYGNGSYFGTADNPYKWLVKARTKTIVECCVHPDCEKIYSGAFSNCTYLRKIVIPSSCTDFEGCLNGLTKLEYVECPYYSTKAFGKALFGCSNSEITALKKVIINGGDIAVEAFKDISSLENIQLEGDIKTIKNYAFKNCQCIADLVLPDSVESIGLESFSGSNIKTLNSSLNLKHIAANGFENCKDLTTVNLRKVSSLGSYAFRGCTSLNSLRLSSSLLAIPTSAFENCTSLEAVDFSVTSYTTEIKDFAFKGCTALKSAKLNNVTKLGQGAFEGSGIESIYINSIVTYISKEAFKNCTSLSSLDYRSSFIGESMFEGCTALTSISSIYVKEIKANAFKNCTGLQTVNFSKLTDIKLNAFEGSGLTEFKSANALNIGEYAFKNCTSLETVELTNDETYFRDKYAVGSTGNVDYTYINYTFQGCSSLTSVTLPSTMTTIRPGLFKDCTSLAEFDFSNITSIGFNAFENTGFVSLNLGDNIESIGEKAFLNCHKLESLVCTNGLLATSNDAFSGCELLASANIGGNNTIIPERAFSDCVALNSITLGSEISVLGNYAFYNTILNDFTMTSSIRSIGMRTFDGTKFEEINIPSAVTLSNYAFAGSGIKKAILNAEYKDTYIFAGCKSLEEIIISEGIESIPSYLCDSCVALKIVKLPSSLKTIGQYAFTNCSSLESIVIPKNVNTIDDYAFKGCTNLLDVYNYSDIVLEKGSTENGYLAYYANEIHGIFTDYDPIKVNGFIFAIIDNKGYLMGYEGAKTVISLPESFEYQGNTISEYEIYSNAFFNSNIVSITIPESVTAINDYAFGGCYKLVEIYNLSNLDIQLGKGDNGAIALYAVAIHNSLAEDSLVIVENDFVFMIVEESGTKYGVVIGYAGTDTEIVVPSQISYKEEIINVLTISDEAFSNLNVTSAEFEEGIENLGRDIFKNCDSLISVVIPDTVLDSDTNPFASCSIVKATVPSWMIKYVKNNQLEELTVKGGTNISKKELYGYSNLKKVVLSDTITKIEQNAFTNCSSIETIELASSIKHINQYAFSGCRSLKHIVLPDLDCIISDYAFQSCSSLEYVLIPNKSTSVGQYAFYNANSSMKVFCYGTNDEFVNVSVTISKTSYSTTYATKYFYNETKPAGASKYWHFNDEGAPIEYNYDMVYDKLMKVVNAMKDIIQRAVSDSEYAYLYDTTGLTSYSSSELNSKVVKNNNNYSLNCSALKAILAATNEYPLIQTILNSNYYLSTEIYYNSSTEKYTYGFTSSSKIYGYSIYKNEDSTAYYIKFYEYQSF